ncbi:MAG: L-serine ammonia-lyase [Burkholderiaceae bacterium]
MTVSAFDLFKVGIGPSSSHTVGPMRAARMFTHRLERDGALADVVRVTAQLYGSLGATGLGHGSDKAILLGLSGHEPDTVDVDHVPALIARIRNSGELWLGGVRKLKFLERDDLVFLRNESLPLHTNGLRFSAYGDQGMLSSAIYYSTGGGFVVDDSQGGTGEPQAEAPDRAESPVTFHSADTLLEAAAARACSIADLMRLHERRWRTDAETRDGLLRIWLVMQQCVDRGCRTEGVLPGGFRVKRRAPGLAKALAAQTSLPSDPLDIIEWVNLFALAVNEENAAGGRVVTAPTNGAAGIIPAVLHYYTRFVPGANDDGVVDFLLTAAAIGILYKRNASISGAEVGCQGEVGVACSMAAGALCAILGGTPRQVENAAEIGMEHHLGLTCDPVGGLVQIPCIERNALASVKAINAAKMALRGDGRHHVSLDKVIQTMRETGADMMTKYKETALGWLAVHIVEC